MERGAGGPQTPPGQAAGDTVGMGLSLCFPGGHPRLAVLGPGGHLGHSPRLRATSKGPARLLFRGKATEGRSQGSREQQGNAAGKGMLWANSAGGGTGWEVGAELHQGLVPTWNQPFVALSPRKQRCGGGTGPRGKARAGKGLGVPRGKVQLCSRK